MRRRRRRVAVLAVAIALVTGATVLAVTLVDDDLDYPGDSDLRNRLNTEIRRAEDGDGTVAIASATHFAWSRVYQFGPYTSPKEIEETIGFEWDGAEEAAPSAQDCESVLVFVHGREVPSWLFTTDASCKGLRAGFEVPAQGTPYPGVFRLQGASLTPVSR